MSTKTAIAYRHATSIIESSSLNAVMMVLFLVSFFSGLAIALVFNL